MPLYLIREGKEHLGFKAGHIVEHTEQEAKPFLDKLELIQTAPPLAVEEQKPEHVLENQVADEEVPKRRNKKKETESEVVQ
jgi:hypothetical protein